MVELGSELYVLNAFSGNVDACAIAAGSLNCSLAATLPSGGTPGGIGAL